MSPPLCCSYKIEATGQGRRPITGDGRGKEEEEDATSHSVLLSTSTAENQLFRATQEIEPDQLESLNIPPILSNVRIFGKVSTVFFNCLHNQDSNPKILLLFIADRHISSAKGLFCHKIYRHSGRVMLLPPRPPSSSSLSPRDLSSSSLRRLQFPSHRLTDIGGTKITNF